MILLALALLAGLTWWLTSRRPTKRQPGAEVPDPSSGPSPIPATWVLGSPTGNAALSMDGLSKAYGRGSGRRHALAGLDLVVPTGTVLGLVGRNGAGKTTALRCALGLVHPDAGTCRVLGADSTRDLDRVINRVGALIETPGLTAGLSGRQNLATLARVGRLGPAEVTRALASTGLCERADDPVATYSLGMRQRLGIAAALLRDPELLILDEPANGLDPAGIADLRRLLGELTGQGRTIVVSSHILEEVERTCDRIAVIDAGRCLAIGPVEEVLAIAGAGTLTVRVDDTGAAERALAAAGIPTTTTVGGLQVATRDADAGRVADVLADQRIRVTELRHDRPSLEDVFLGLVRHHEHGDADD